MPSGFNRIRVLLGAAMLGSALVLVGCTATQPTAQSAAPEPVSTGPMPDFGGDDSVAYAGTLWRRLVERNLAGPGALSAKPYEGTHPHGIVLVSYETPLKMGAHTGVVVVKNNYGGEGVSVSAVADDPDRYLESVTVMFKREPGYDVDNKDWFWAKFKPEGNVDVNSGGVPLAGRVAKGKPEGCIACHKLAPGADYVFNHDRFVD